MPSRALKIAPGMDVISAVVNKREIKTPDICNCTVRKVVASTIILVTPDIKKEYPQRKRKSSGKFFRRVTIVENRSANMEQAFLPCLGLSTAGRLFNPFV